MNGPLVSVICLCHNQGRFIRECIGSVIQQTYPNIEIIIVDDGSTDESREIIDGICIEYPDIIRIYLEHSGNCAAFNKGFQASHGEFIVDLAADDVFHPDRLELQLEKFSQLPETYGVIYTDAEIIDRNGNSINTQHEIVSSIHNFNSLPEGMIFYDLIDKYFISAPTMLVKRSVLEELGGYDESLYYEDFDFWVRSAKNWHYAYIPKCLTLVRRHNNNMSLNMYGVKDKKVGSTLKVCEKIYEMDSSVKGRNALKRRVAYEWRMAVKHYNVPWVFRWLKYYFQIGGRVKDIIKKNS